jgi:hypothetical protein
MNPPTHPAFEEIVKHVEGLDTANVRFAIRFLETLLDGRAEMMWKRTRLEPKLKDVFQLAAWLETKRVLYIQALEKALERAEHDAGDRRDHTADGAGASVPSDSSG